MIQIDNEECFARAVEEFSDMIYRIAYQCLMNVSDSEDVMQEVFLKLVKRRPSFHDGEHMKAWLIRVTVNQCRDVMRANYRSREIPAKDYEWYEAAADEGAGDAMREAVWEALETLPPEDRTIVYLHYYEGYAIREIAAILGRRASTVNTRLDRARKRLGRLLEEERENRHEKSISGDDRRGQGQRRGSRAQQRAVPGAGGAKEDGRGEHRGFDRSRDGSCGGGSGRMLRRIV